MICIPVILVLVNFSADSYIATVNANSVHIFVTAFGSFVSPFLVEVKPDVTGFLKEGTYVYS